MDTITHFISECEYRELIKPDRERTIKQVYMYENISTMRANQNYFSVELTTEQQKEARDFRRLFNVERLLTYKLDFKMYQLSKRIGHYETTVPGPSYINRVNVPFVLEEANKSGPIVVYALHKDGHTCRDFNDSDTFRLLSVVALYYNHETSEFYFKDRLSDFGKLIENNDLLSDIDDPALTLDNIPAVLEYLEKIVLEKNKEMKEQFES